MVGEDEELTPENSYRVKIPASRELKVSIFKLQMGKGRRKERKV